MNENYDEKKKNELKSKWQNFLTGSDDVDENIVQRYKQQQQQQRQL